MKFLDSVRIMQNQKPLKNFEKINFKRPYHLKFARMWVLFHPYFPAYG